MFKFLVRRIRYAFTGKMMKLFGFLFSSILLVAIFFFVFGGFFSQKQAFKGLFNIFYKASQDTADKIENDDTPFTVTDEGVYLKGHEVGNKVSGDSSNKSDSENEKTEKESEKTSEQDKTKDSNEEETESKEDN